MGAAEKMDEAQGHGRPVRPSSKKVRINKVYTAKGPRDRRVRLSAVTAIQFYDVQDRLGYERASEAVDWLIQKAKGSIDKLLDTNSQQFEHLNHLDAQNYLQSDYHAGILSERGKFADRIQNFHNLSDNSINISGCNYVGNCISPSNSSSMLELGNGQIERMIMFNSTSNDSSSAHTTTAHQPSVILSSGLSSDEIAKFYISTQFHGNQ